MTAPIEQPEVPLGDRAGAAAECGGQSTRDLPDGTGRVPDFFLVGHQKCGSTALYEMLKAHPQIFMSEVKTPLYFANDLYPRRQSSYAPESANQPRTLESYLSLFALASSDQLVGEASHQYIRSSVAARNIAEHRPDARIVTILREPAGFLRSFHNENVHNQSETEKDFASALALEEPRRRGERIPRLCREPKMLLYSEHVRYVEQLRRFHEQFSRERVLVLIYDDFRADNVASIREVQRFLGVDTDVPIETVETKRMLPVRSQHLQRVTQRTRRALSIAENNPAHAGPLARATNAVLRPGLRRKFYRTVVRRALYTKPPPPDEALMLELQSRFKPEVVALSEYLDRDLVALWGYDKIA